MSNYKKILGVLCVVASILPSATTVDARERALTVNVGAVSRAPIGWIDFCREQNSECQPHAATPRSVPLTTRAWKELVQVNQAVNDAIIPMTDLEHHGVVEKWSYPDDGYGDCEDYVLLKRRLLAEAGWPKQSLLITVVRDTKGEGHAILTVKTDRGEFVLDNQHPDVLLWSETEYEYVKRQSQYDPNVWVALGDPRPAAATASAR